MMSVILPEPIPSIENRAPWPPPVNVIVSVASFKAPSFVIVFEEGIPVILALINLSVKSDEVPLITSSIKNVPTIVSWLTINSETWSPPKAYLNTFSTIAVAPEVSPVIVLQTNKFVVSVLVESSIARITFLVFHLPSDTLNICSLGYFVSAVSLNNILKNISCPLLVPFNLYKDLIFLIRFLLWTSSSNNSGNVAKN